MANATLTFKLANTGVYSIDPTTKNPIPLTRVANILAFLEPVKPDDQIVKLYPGIDETQQLMTGRLINPLTFPVGVGHLSKANAVISNRTGIFELHLDMPDALGISSLIGVKVFGIFREITDSGSV